MSTQIIIDSACDMLKAEADLKGLIFLSLRTRIDGVEYKDGVSITHEAFYQRLESSAELPTTSQVPPFDFAKAYQQALKDHDEALVVTISGKLSGTAQSARIAAKDFPGKIHIVDSENVTVGERVLVDYAVRLRDEGRGAAEIAEALNAVKSRICILGLVDTLEYLYKGGRLSRTSAFVGSALHLKPVLSVVKGELVVLGKARGSRQSNNYLNETIQRRGGVDFSMPYMLAYSGNDDALLRGYIENSRAIWAAHTEKVPVCVVGSTIGSHTGPGVIAVAFFCREGA